VEASLSIIITISAINTQLYKCILVVEVVVVKCFIKSISKLTLLRIRSISSSVCVIDSLRCFDKFVRSSFEGFSILRLRPGGVFCSNFLLADLGVVTCFSPLESAEVDWVGFIILFEVPLILLYMLFVFEFGSS
jgi:hypothetical protein